MPLFQSLFSFAAYLKEFGAEELEELPLVLLLIVGIPGLMICLFFSFIEKKPLRSPFDFYIVTIGGFFIKSLDTNFSAERISDNDRFSYDISLAE